MFPEFKENLGSVTMPGYKAAILNDMHHSPHDLSEIVREILTHFGGHSHWERRGIFILPNEYADYSPLVTWAGLREGSLYENVSDFLQQTGFSKIEKVDLPGATKSGKKPFPNGYTITNDDIKLLMPKIVTEYNDRFVPLFEREVGEPSELVIATSFKPKENYQQASIWMKYV